MKPFASADIGKPVRLNAQSQWPGYHGNVCGVIPDGRAMVVCETLASILFVPPEHLERGAWITQWVPE